MMYATPDDSSASPIDAITTRDDIDGRSGTDSTASSSGVSIAKAITFCDPASSVESTPSNRGRT